MSFHRSWMCRGLAFIAFLSLSATAGAIDGPRAAFTIEDDFLRATITSDGSQPVIATILVRLENGTIWARGETDETGSCLVPMPVGERCEFEIRMPEIDPQIVVLTFLDAGKSVIPLVAPLNPGECCVQLPRPDPTPRNPSSFFAKNLPFAIGMITFLVLVTLFGLATRMLRNPQK